MEYHLSSVTGVMWIILIINDRGITYSPFPATHIRTKNRHQKKQASIVGKIKIEKNICQYLSIKDVVDVFNWLYPPICFLVRMLEPIPENTEQEL